MISLTKITAFLLVGMLMNACTVEKRLYRKGFHMEWRNKTAAVSGGVEPVSTETVEIRQKNDVSREAATLPAAELLPETAVVDPIYTDAAGKMAGDHFPHVEELPVINEDSVKIGQQYNEDGISSKEIEDYKTMTLVISLVFVALIVLCFVPLIEGSVISLGAFLLLIFAVFLFIAMLITLAIRSELRPDVVARRERERGIEQKKNVETAKDEPVTIPEEETSPEKWTKAEEAQRKKRRGIIAVSVLLATVGLIIYFGSK